MFHIVFKRYPYLPVDSNYVISGETVKQFKLHQP